MEIKRDRYLNLLISKRHNGLVKVITGMRRCGKSYLLFHLFKESLLLDGISEDHIIEIAFDAFENKPFRDPDVLYRYLKEQIKDDWRPPRFPCRQGSQSCRSPQITPKEALSRLSEISLGGPACCCFVFVLSIVKHFRIENLLLSN